MTQKICDPAHSSCDMKMFGSVTVGTKWQVVIPKEIRESLSISPGDTLMVLTKHDKAIGMVKADDMQAFMEYMQKEMAK